LTTERAPHPRFELCGAELIADVSGVVYWPAEATLAVADLHLEKGSSFARRGIFLPPYDTRATLKALDHALQRHKPRRVIALGDSFHDRAGAARLAPSDHALLSALMSGREWVWVLGNHDPAPPADLGGTSVDEIRLGPLTFRHEPQAGSAGEIAGHLHPCATVQARGRRVRRRCFAFDGNRVVLPSFGAYTGGLSVLDQAFAMILRAPFQAMLLGRERVYPVSHAKLLPDAA
jgi:uncharacterized protein